MVKTTFDVVVVAQQVASDKWRARVQVTGRNGKAVTYRLVGWEGGTEAEVRAAARPFAVRVQTHLDFGGRLDPKFWERVESKAAQGTLAAMFS
jgi:hypothetical protein